ncbi:MAG: phosphoglycerate kinase [Candidatus Niyogibacteria bacterium CG10_big_fil_rev_8_21_14_0_10_46_36]|uniref:Phosphoglycerate kinase n=1 Tax=Candidatus Niyogibacteria bacterium CG10_big_fil_rev_8_21_14_0_10_46_36 TaxID=1974726 RepID=A0A2H0TCB6_9BACT|nr:MAG: phosphoglycerate kinase [Candidatus Niyogibacteria bacterium CG10_big_fil_rev_8_21_14_0_10_46_36]
MPKRLSLLPSRLREKRVLMRVDFNVPVKKGHVQDDMRIQKTLPTIKALRECRHKIILLSHMEDENGGTPTLLPIATYLRMHGMRQLIFSRDLDVEHVNKKIESMGPGDILLLENVRKDPREKKNSIQFAEELASFGDVFINEAFSASHRAHASIVGIPRFLPSYAGPLFREEVRQLSRVFRPSHPFLLVLGGRKPVKLTLLSRFLYKADAVVVGGAIANTILAAQGIAVGASVIETAEKKIIEKLARSKKILLPEDVVVERNKRRKTILLADMESQDIIYDLGPKTMEKAEALVGKSKFILWNGPLGYTEKGYVESTEELVSFFANGKRTVITGGGDTIAFLNQKKMLNSFSFVSTGGGAMLDFLAEHTLPGIEALIHARV